MRPGPSGQRSIGRRIVMAEFRVPAVVRLLFEIAPWRLTVKKLDRERTELRERLARLEQSRAL
jgi:hypothetical protein